MKSRRVLSETALLLLAVSCAPRLARPPELVPEARAARYRALLSERQARGVAVSANLVMWAERAPNRRLPGAQAELFLAAPDRLRLRVASGFGTALDLGLAGDSLRAYVPAWRTGLRVDAAQESLGLRSPGVLVFRALCGTWEPPAEVWERGAWEDTLLKVAWPEGGDSLAMRIGATGLPAWVELARPDGDVMRARYVAWDRSSGTAWPAHLVLEDERRGLRLVCRASQVRFRPRADPVRLAVRFPSDAEALTLDELRTVLDRLGVL